MVWAVRSALHRTDPILGTSADSSTIGLPTPRVHIRFDRGELKRILNLWPMSSGEWRDYALDFRDDAAVFSVSAGRRNPALFDRKRPLIKTAGPVLVVAPGGQVLGRAIISRCLRVL